MPQYRYVVCLSRCPSVTFTDLHFASDSFCLASFEFCCQAPNDYFIAARVTFKVTDLGANRKRVYDFLFVRYSNLSPIFCTVSEISQFFVLLTSPLFHPNFWGVPVAPDRPCWGQPEQRP